MVFSLKARARSFGYAVEGLWLVLRTQHNAWIHLAATIAVCIAGLLLRIQVQDWCWLVAVFALVWFAEVINTAFEHLCDLVSPGLHPSVKHAKDVAAGAVLICAIAAALIGTLVFWPYLFS